MDRAPLPGRLVAAWAKSSVDYLPSAARSLADGVGEQRFDGNHSDAAEHWWFIDGASFDREDIEHSMLTLLERTVEGCFSWVVFPLRGFRV